MGTESRAEPRPAPSTERGSAAPSRDEFDDDIPF
jgi:hypothetical protein